MCYAELPTKKKKSTLNSKEDKLFLETTVTGNKASV